MLFYGILGAIVFRAIFIGLGAAIIESFHWAIYIFGVLLLYHGLPDVGPAQRAHDRPARTIRCCGCSDGFVPTTDGYRGQRFIVHEGGRRLATPLLAVLVVVESSDILFAIDSVPAIFSVTTDTFLVFSSNAFAILGLRSLYFLLAGAVDKFRYLKPGLAALLIFAGMKILLAEIAHIHIPIPLSLAIIVGILVVGHRRLARWPTGSTAAEPRTRHHRPAHP